MEQKQYSKKIFKCEECGFCYTEEKLAQECAAWCKKHNSCNSEIAKQAVPCNE